MKRVIAQLVFWFKNLSAKKKPVQNNRVIFKKRVMKGLQVWEADLKTGDVVQAEMEITISYDENGKPRKNRKVLIRENCIYEYALNGHNAVRKLETRIANILKPAR